MMLLLIRLLKKQIQTPVSLQKTFKMIDQTLEQWCAVLLEQISNLMEDLWEGTLSCIWTTKFSIRNFSLEELKKPNAFWKLIRWTEAFKIGLQCKHRQKSADRSQNSRRFKAAPRMYKTKLCGVTEDKNASNRNVKILQATTNVTSSDT